MKIFGWGKSNDSQPQVHQQVIASDPRDGIHGLDRGTPGMGCVLPSDSLPANAEGDLGEKAQDKLQFVFSHDQEGLLAIGTFVLEQLHSIRSTVDGHDCKGSDPGDHEFGFDSEVNLLALDNDVMQSFEDEDQLQGSWIAARKTCDLPVFGDASEPLSDLECPASRNRIRMQQPSHKESKALTLYEEIHPTHTPAADDAPAFILAPEFRSSLPRPLPPHWNDSVPPPVLAEAEEGRSVDDDHYSPRLCGLLSHRKSPKSHELKYNLMAAIPADGENDTPLLPVVRTKRSALLFDGGPMPLLGSLAKLWRAACTPTRSGRIAPQHKSGPSVRSKVPMCDSRGRNKARKHELMIRDLEHWTKEDKDCEFATFLFNTSQ